MNACTIIARNYLAYARVLAASYARHHDGARLSVLVIDGAVGDTMLAQDSEPFETILPVQLPLPSHEYQRMAAMYDVTELATALKPVLLRYLLDRGGQTAMYLDPDIEVFAPLDDLGRLAGTHAIVLIPHTLAPFPLDGCKPTFAEVAAAGVYNLGFIAVSQAARPSLEWWAERLRRDCLLAPDEGLFFDQRFIDFFPAFFAPHIVRDRAYNVAYWNLHERRVTWTGKGYEVGGTPLGFFHFSGFNPMTPHVLSKHQGTTPRIVPTADPDLARLCREYGDRLLAAGYRACLAIPYRFATTANGVPFDGEMRRLYRQGILAAERGTSAEPPCPLDRGQAEAFMAWVRAHGAPTPSARARAAALIETNPYLGSQHALVRLAQRAFLRLLRPLLLHEQSVARALLESLEEKSREGRNGA